MNIPGADFPFPVIIDRDLDGLKLAAKHDIDFIALSMVRSAKDIRIVREEAKKHGVNGKLVAKIETQKALDDIDKIIDASDGIMIARGDLGVEIPIERVPFYQKLIIKQCMIHGKFVITATQMLQTMIDNPFPTRAEISDIANAVYDLTDCIMLSGETASGKHPLKQSK
jgi:pyruvate kinase